MKEISEKVRKEMDDHYSLDNAFWPHPLYPVKYNLSNLSKKDLKKLNHGIRSTRYIRSDIGLNVQKHYIQYPEVKAIHVIYDKVGLSDRERRNHWIYQRTLQHILHDSYSKKPTPEGRDNKDVHVGSGMSGYRGNSVRYPKKSASKSTWTKFYKLFPKAKQDG